VKTTPQSPVDTKNSEKQHLDIKESALKSKESIFLESKVNTIISKKFTDIIKKA